MTHEEQTAAALALESKQIHAGARLTEFLADPAIVQGLKDIEKRYYAEFSTTTGDAEALKAIWAKNHALQDLIREIAAIQGAAEIAAHTRVHREAQEARTPRKTR